jgi:hypothetical protein
VHKITQKEEQQHRSSRRPNAPSNISSSKRDIQDLIAEVKT